MASYFFGPQHPMGLELPEGKARHSAGPGILPHDDAQLGMPGCDHEPSRLLLQRKADAPLKSDVPQKPMDIGLFSDEADQLDLVEMLQEPTND